MSMRTINPPRRFINFPFVVSSFGGADIANLVEEFRFETDSVLHTCNMQVQFSVPPIAGAVFASLAVTLSSLSGTDINTNPNNALLYVRASNGFLSGPPTTTQLLPFTAMFEADNMLVRAGTILQVVYQDNTLAFVQAEGGVSISFTPLSEWVNFREPTVGVRL